MPLHFSVRDKIVAVTGGGSGIGLAYCLLARQQGAKKVILADLRLTGAAQQAVQSDENIIFQECDVAKWKDLQNMIDVSMAKLGDVPDIYIASAGVFEPPYSNFWEDPEPLDANGYAQIDINVNHPIKLTRLAMRALLGRDKEGVVVLLSSIAGYSKNYSTPIYCATKHALVGFTRSLGDAEEIQGVKIVCVCPGIVKTPLWTEGTPGAAARFGIVDDISLTPDAVAAAISEVVESPEIPGGAVFEVSKLGGTRVIPDWNISPPQRMQDGKAAKGTVAPPEMIQNVLGPILKITEAERGKLRQS
ncbi:hypothetical protein diail_10868 [Diaporthe ilicicola]|nr:hypothetical protein diail_10868 [Diaporthe ilicicola]